MSGLKLLSPGRITETNVMIEGIFLAGVWFETVIPWKNNKRKLFVRQYWIKYLLL